MNEGRRSDLPVIITRVDAYSVLSDPETIMLDNKQCLGGMTNPPFIISPECLRFFSTFILG